MALMVQDYKYFFTRHSNLIFFVGGFIFDAVTIIRIDSFLDIAIQAVYLIGITLLLIYKEKEQSSHWAPDGFLKTAWRYETEALHFFYGGLLSAYVVLYFKSTSLSRSLIFLSLIVFLMVANEMPQIRRAGSYLRLGLYVFCVISFLNYLIPIFLGQLGGWVFGLAWMASALIVYIVVKKIFFFRPYGTRRSTLWLPPVSVLILVALLYFLKLIPPVPLSVQYVGFFRQIEKTNGAYKLTYQKPPFYRFWQKDERIFQAIPGDIVYCFVRVFAPTHFEHQIFVKWSVWHEGSQEWIPSDRIPISIKGGRGEGFRGFTAKENYSEGLWRVEIETEDGRSLAVREVKIKTPLLSNKEQRQFVMRRM